MLLEEFVYDGDKAVTILCKYPWDIEFTSHALVSLLDLLIALNEVSQMGKGSFMV